MLLEGETLDEITKRIENQFNKSYDLKRREQLKDEYKILFKQAEEAMNGPMYSVQIPDIARSGSMYLYIDKKLQPNQYKINRSGGPMSLISKENIDKIRISSHTNQSRIVQNGPNVSDDKNFRSISDAKSYLKDKYGLE